MDFKLGIAVIFLTMITFVGVFTGAVVARPVRNSIETPDFIRKAVISNMFEVQASEIALQRSHSEDVRNFAQQMINDHSTTAEKMAAILSPSDWSMMPKTLDQSRRSALTQLRKSPYKDFDRLYIKSQTKAHREAVNLYRKYAREGSSPQLKSFATQMLPALIRHQKHADLLHKS